MANLVIDPPDGGCRVSFFSPNENRYSNPSTQTILKFQLLCFLSQGNILGIYLVKVISSVLRPGLLWSVLFSSTASFSASSTPLASSLSRWGRSLVIIVVVIIAFVIVVVIIAVIIVVVIIVVSVVFLIVVKVQKLINVVIEQILFPAKGGARGGG